MTSPMTMKAYRIPGIVAVDSTVLVFAEGRKYGCGDFAGQHDVVVKKSTDGGATFAAPLQVLLDPSKQFGAAVCGNRTSTTTACQYWDPTPVYDAHTGVVTVMTTLTTSAANRMSGVMTSWTVSTTDLGESWSAPVNITAQIYSEKWHMHTPANGHGVQLSTGRLLMPGYVRVGGDKSEKSSVVRVECRI